MVAGGGGGGGGGEHTLFLRAPVAGRRAIVTPELVLAASCRDDATGRRVCAGSALAGKLAELRGGGRGWGGGLVGRPHTNNTLGRV